MLVLLQLHHNCINQDFHLINCTKSIQIYRHPNPHITLTTQKHNRLGSFINRCACYKKKLFSHFILFAVLTKLHLYLSSAVCRCCCCGCLAEEMHRDEYDIYRTNKWAVVACAYRFGILHFVRPSRCINVAACDTTKYLVVSCVLFCCVRAHSNECCFVGFYLLLVGVFASFSLSLSRLFLLLLLLLRIRWMIIFGVYFSRVFLSCMWLCKYIMKWGQIAYTHTHTHVNVFFASNVLLLFSSFAAYYCYSLALLLCCCCYGWFCCCFFYSFSFIQKY